VAASDAAASASHIGTQCEKAYFPPICGMGFGRQVSRLLTIGAA
jgi:hypothetical protein